MDMSGNLWDMKRSKLQKLAKMYGIKANGKSMDIICALEKVKQQRLAVTLAKPEQVNVEAATERNIMEGTKTVKDIREFILFDDTLLNKEMPSSSGLMHKYKHQHMSSSSSPYDLSTTPTIVDASGAKDSIEDDVSCAAGIDCDAGRGEEQMSCKTPEKRVEGKEKDMPFSPPSNGKGYMSSTRKRNLTFTKRTDDGEEGRGEEGTGSPQAKRARRSTYEVAQSDSFIMAGGGVDGTGTRTSGEDANIVGSECVLNPVPIVSSPTTACDADGCGDGMTLRDEILNLLEQKVVERMADSSYVPPPSHALLSSSTVPANKTPIALKFDEAHRANFKRMKSITSCHQNTGRKGVGRSCRHTGIKEQRIKEQRIKERKKSLTTKARARMSSVTLVKAKTSRVHGVGVKSAVALNKSVNFGSLTNKDKSKPRIRKGPSLKKDCENSPVPNRHVHQKRKMDFDLQASLKRPKSNYTPYRGKLPPFQI